MSQAVFNEFSATNVSNLNTCQFPGIHKMALGLTALL